MLLNHLEFQSRWHYFEDIIFVGLAKIILFFETHIQLLKVRIFVVI